MHAAASEEGDQARDKKKKLERMHACKQGKARFQSVAEAQQKGEEEKRTEFG